MPQGAGDRSVEPPDGLSVAGLAVRRSGRLIQADVGFHLDPGRALVVTGPNGCGKSSLLRVLAGLDRADAGRLDRAGRPVEENPAAHRTTLAYVGHQEAVKPSLTVAESLWFWTAGTPEAVRRAHLQSALAAFALDRLADLPGRLLSAGQRRRVALARLVAAPRPLWILDEPTTALDAQAVATLGRVMDRHLDGGGMIVAATHGRLPLASVPARLPLDPLQIGIDA